MMSNSAGNTKRSNGSDKRQDERNITSHAEAAAANSATVNWFDVLPSNRIHAQLQRDEGVGRLSKQASRFIGASSALFLQDLLQASIDARDETSGGDDENSTGTTNNSRITLEHVRTAASRYPFLEGVLSTLTEEGAPKVKRHKSTTESTNSNCEKDTSKKPATRKRKSNPSVKEAKQTMEAVAPSIAAELAHDSTMQIEQDEDEYD